MSIPRINPRIMSEAVRASLERAQAQAAANRKAREASVSVSNVKIGGSHVDNHYHIIDNTTGEDLTKKWREERKREEAAQSVVREKIKKRRTKKTLTIADIDGLVKGVKVSEDGNEVKLVLAQDPGGMPTAQGKGAFVDKGGHVHFFTKPKQRKAEEAFKTALEPYAHLTSKWGKVPIELEFKLFFGYPSGTPKKNRHKIGPHTEKPDGDNLVKGPIDAMTRAGFWPDDSCINTYHIYKRRTTGPVCIVIKITNLQPKFEALYADTAEYQAPTLFNCQSTPKRPEETNPLLELQVEEIDEKISTKGN